MQFHGGNCVAVPWNNLSKWSTTSVLANLKCHVQENHVQEKIITDSNLVGLGEGLNCWFSGDGLRVLLLIDCISVK